MKKLLSFIILSLMTLSSFADGLFVKGVVGKGSTTATLDLMYESSRSVQAVGSEIHFPEGITPTGIESVCEVPIMGFNVYDVEGVTCLKFSMIPKTAEQEISESSEPVCIAKITVTVDSEIELGDHEVVCKLVEFAWLEGSSFYDDGVGTITVQKTAVIEPLTDGYSLEVLPFVAKEGSSTIDVLFKSAATAKSVTFDMELPQGMMFYDEEFAPSKAVLNASACTKTPTATLTVTDEENANKATVSVMGQNTGAAALRKYINQLDELTTLVSIPVYVVPADEIADWGDEYALNEGVYEVKLNNIVVTDYASNATFTGNYIASIIVGQPSVQEAILYGHYNEATASAFTTPLKNVAIADVTVATVDEDAKFTDVLVNVKGGNSYYTRTSANYGTTVLPLDLTTANVDKLYKIESMDANSIVLTEAENVPANTPCIFKGTINVEGATPILGVPSEQGLGQTTFKGTYEATEIADGAGYYISSDGKFYGDGASVRPFRGYFDGAIAGVKSFSVFVDTANGLIDITDQLSDEAIYSLQGIRMSNAQKGINIKGGKKVYVK